MTDFIRRRGRGSRFASIAVSAAMVVGVGLIATPASADPGPPANFLPDSDGAADFGTDTAYSNVLSDRFDGTDQLAHLASVATSDTVRYEWYVCATSVGAAVSNAELAGSCDKIGEDSTPNVPTGGTLLNPADEAYEFFWDIPTILDTTIRHILGIACVSAGVNLDAPNPNCRQDNEQNIRLDDAAGGTVGQTSSGEITQYCTAGPALCEVAATTPGSAARALIDARFKPLEHGDPVPNTGLTVRFTTSPDFAAAANLCIGTDFAKDANVDPADVDAGGCSTPLVENKATFKIWEQTLADGAIPDNTEFAMWIEDFDTGEGFCAGDGDPPPGPETGPHGAGPVFGDCHLDVHYHAGVERAPAKVVQSWTGNGGHTHLPPSPGATAGCEAGETPVKAHANEDLAPGITETGEICVTDQFNDPMSGVNVLEEITSPGNIAASGNDHDGDGRNEHDDGGTTNAAGIYTFTVNNFNATVGTATLTSCVETEPLSTTTGHGCANETLKDTLSIAFATLPTEVFLSYAGTGSATDPCRTGATIAQGTVGQRESLLVCTFDSEGNLISTEVDGSRLQWQIVGAHGNDAPSVGFVGAPPTETGGNGQSTLQIDDIGAGDNFIIVRLLNANGDAIDAFQIEKDVRGGPDDRCDKIKKKIRRVKKKIRKAKKAGDQDLVKKLRKRLRVLRALKRRFC